MARSEMKIRKGQTFGTNLDHYAASLKFASDVTNSSGYTDKRGLSPEGRPRDVVVHKPSNDPSPGDEPRVDGSDDGVRR